MIKKEKFDSIVTELADFLEVEITLEGTPEEQADAFMKAVEEVPSEDEGKLPESVIDLYNSFGDNKLTAVDWGNGEKDKVEKPSKKITKVKKEKEKPAPVKKEKEKPALVKKETAPLAKKVPPKPAKVEKVKVEKVKKEKKVKEPIATSRYGHREGSAAAVMDEILWRGVTLDEAVATLVKLGKTKERAKGMFLAHIYYLPDKKNIPIDKPKDEKGKYKAKKAETDV